MENLIVKSIVCFSCVVMISISSCSIHKDRMLLKAIAGGADPLEARLAFSSQTSTYQIVPAMMAKYLGDDKK